MLYIFKSKAAGNVIMLQPNAERILRIIGKEPEPKGIILPEQMPGAITALQGAIQDEEQGRAKPPPSGGTDDKNAADEGGGKAEHVSLRQRAVPFLDMLERCHNADKEIVWGV